MQVNDPHTLLRNRHEERLGENMHPPGQDDQVRAVLQHLVRKHGVVLLPGLLEPLWVLLPFGLEPACDHVEVFGGHAGLVGASDRVRALAIHKQAYDLGILDVVGSQCVEEGLEVATAAAGQDDGSDGRGGWR